MRSAPSLASFPSAALETVPVFILLKMALARKIVHRFLFLRRSSPGDRWCEVLDFTPAYNNNNVHLSCAHQRPERSHDTYKPKYDILYTCRA